MHQWLCISGYEGYLCGIIMIIYRAISTSWSNTRVHVQYLEGCTAKFEGKLLVDVYGDSDVLSSSNT